MLKWFRKLINKSIEAENPLVEENGMIDFSIYEVKKSRPVVVLHPILAGSNTVARGMANYFTIVHRWNAVVISRFKYPFEADSPEGFERKLIDIIKNNQQAYKYLVEYFGHDNFFSVGTSMGAMVNASLIPYIPYKGFVCVMGGGPIVEVMLKSNMSRFDDWLERQMPEYGENEKEVKESYENVVVHDPVKNADTSKSHKVFMISAFFDKAVPRSTQAKLNKALRKWFVFPFRVWFPVGHYSMLIMLPVAMIMISTFLVYRYIMSRFNW